MSATTRHIKPAGLGLKHHDFALRTPDGQQRAIREEIKRPWLAVAGVKDTHLRTTLAIAQHHRATQLDNGKAATRWRPKHTLNRQRELKGADLFAGASVPHAHGPIVRAGQQQAAVARPVQAGDTADVPEEGEEQPAGARRPDADG